MMSMDYFRTNGKENLKILKSYSDVWYDYSKTLLAMLAVLVAGLEVTSGSLECVPVVNCRNIANNISNASWPQVNLKFSSICKKYHRSQTTSFAERTEVVTDQNINCLYKSFVISECSKSAIPNYRILWIVLFAEALLLFFLDDLWSKIPSTSLVIETFVDLVTACYDSPYPNFDTSFALFKSNYNKARLCVSISNDDTPNMNDEFYNLDSLPDSTTTSALKGLYEKVQTLEQNMDKSRFIFPISHLYTIKNVLQVFLIISFFIIHWIHYLKRIKDTMTCTLTQSISVPHDYFLCSNGLAPALYSIVAVYTMILFVSGAFLFDKSFRFIQLCRTQNIYDFSEKLPKQSFDQLSDVDPKCGDLGFFLHLLDSYNKMYVIRFAYFLSKKNRKKIDAHKLNIKFPVSLLQATVEKEQKLSFSTVPGVPQTIFDQFVCENLVHLKFSNCRFYPDSFENFNKLTYLKDLSMLDCHLTSIPKGILDLAGLEELHLGRNLIKKIDVEISALKKIKILRLDNNKLQTIAPKSLTRLENLESLNIEGNHDLKIDALREVLSCKNLCHLEYPSHLAEIVTDEFNGTE